VTLNDVPNRNRCTQRPEILHRGTYWWTVLGDQKLGHPDLLYWVLGYRRKCLYLHYLCEQLACDHQICIVGATDRVQQLPRIWPTFRGHRGQTEQKTGWHKSWPLYTKTCNLVCADPLAHPDRTPKTRSPWPTLLVLRLS